MNELEQLRMRVEGLTLQVQLLQEQVRDFQENGGMGDVLVLRELCRINGWTLAQAYGEHRTRAVEAMRDGMSAARVGRVFGITGRQVRNLTKGPGRPKVNHRDTEDTKD
jgi:hypothetical protein